MARNVLISESMDERWSGMADLGVDKIRMQPTLVCILDALRRATQGKGDQIRYGTLKYELIALIVDDRLERCYRTLGTVLGYDGTPVPGPDNRPSGTR